MTKTVVFAPSSRKKHQISLTFELPDSLYICIDQFDLLFGDVNVEGDDKLSVPCTVVFTEDKELCVKLQLFYVENLYLPVALEQQYFSLLFGLKLLGVCYCLGHVCSVVLCLCLS